MNPSEAAFAVWISDQGWRAVKGGWPDFLCFRDGEVMAVEVKFSDTLSRAQQEACVMLSAYGIRTYVWTPGDRSLTPIGVTDAGPDVVHKLTQVIDELRAENVQLRRDREALKRQLRKWRPPEEKHGRYLPARLLE